MENRDSIHKLVAGPKVNPLNFYRGNSSPRETTRSSTNANNKWLMEADLDRQAAELKQHMINYHEAKQQQRLYTAPAPLQRPSGPRPSGPRPSGSRGAPPKTINLQTHTGPPPNRMLPRPSGSRTLSPAARRSRKNRKTRRRRN